jgi:hypothetical protein
MSTGNPNELVDRYLQAVRFWLPKSERQEGLIAELGEDLRSQIDEKETELGRVLNENEVSAILRRCGAPMEVAGRLGPERYLIGPTLFPIYKFVLKLVLLWILVPVFLFIVGPVNVARSGHWGSGVAATIGDLWWSLLINAGIITLVFAILERTRAVAGVASKWDPLKLPPVPRTERKPASRLHTVSQLCFAGFGLVWLLLLPEHPFLILGPAAGFLQAAPMWHRFYAPIVLLGILAIARSTVTLAKAEWNWFPPLGELIQSVCTLILLNFLLRGWFPYVVLTEAAKNSAEYIRVAAIVNGSILISLASAWLGLSIAIVVQLWQVLRSMRKRGVGGHAASLPVQ